MDGACSRCGKAIPAGAAICPWCNETAQPTGFPPPPPGAAPAQTNVLAIVSMSIGIFSWVACLICGLFSIPFSIASVVCGHLALAGIRKNPALGGRGMAIAGLVLGYLAIVLTVVGFVIIVLIMGADMATRPSWGR